MQKFRNFVSQPLKHFFRKHSCSYILKTFSEILQFQVHKLLDLMIIVFMKNWIKVQLFQKDKHCSLNRGFIGEDKICRQIRLCQEDDESLKPILKLSDLINNPVALI